MKKRMIAFLIMTIMLVSSMSTVFAASFSDLPSEHWAYEYITTLADKGVINGYTDGTYRPEKAVTRGEFIKLIMVALYDGNEYFEINNPGVGHWALPYVVEANLQGYLTNKTNISELDADISRLEMSHILAKICIENNFNDSLNNGESAEFTDISELDDVSQVYINIIAERGLINGYTDGTFKPDKTMTRAEVAVILSRFNDLIW